MVKKLNIMLSQKGFTLIELLLVIAVIAIIGAVVFAALDPLTRLRDSRDANRWSDVNEIMSAIKLDQVDNGGSYLPAITALTAGTVYHVGTAVTGCDVTCDTPATVGTDCVDLSGLVTEGYLGSVPISPDGTGTWDATLTGYTLQKESTGIIKLFACESENTTSISISR